MKELASAERRKHFFLEVSKRRNSFSLEVAKLPFSISIDPQYHIFRRLYPEEIIPGLNAFLEDPEKIFVVPNREDEERQKVYMELARMAKEKKGGEILSLREMTVEKVLSSSLMLLGESWKDPLFSKLISNLFSTSTCLQERCPSSRDDHPRIGAHHLN